MAAGTGPSRRTSPTAGAAARAAARKSSAAARSSAEARSNARRPNGGQRAAARSLQGSGCEAFVAAGEQALQQRVLGILGLDQHFATTVFAAGTSGDLHDGLREALGGTKIGAEQSLVGIEYHYQRQARKMMTLGHDLRAHEDARLAR